MAVAYLTAAILLVEISRAFELSRSSTAGLVVLFALGVYGFSYWAFHRIEQHHQALRSSEERYAAFVRNSSEGIWRIELHRPIDLTLPLEEKVDLVFEQGYYAEVNDAFLAMYGTGAEKLVDCPLIDSLPKEENADMVRMFFESDLRVSDVVSQEVTPDGRTLFIQSNCHGVVENGRLIRIWGNQIDITDRHEAAQELERQSSLLSGAERIAQTGSWTYEPGSRRFTWSDNLFVIGGVEPGGYDLTLENVLEIIHREEQDRWREKLERVVRDGEPFTTEIRILHKSGSWIHLEVRAEPIFDERTGDVVEVAGISRDITREKMAEMALQELELQVRQLQKAEALGSLAGGIAHDFNNILSATMGYTDIALGELDPGHPAYDAVKEIEKANFRAKDLVEQILKHSRRFEPRREPVAPASVVREALGLLKSTLADHEVEIDDREALSTQVMGDPSQLHQVVVNLCTNACQAMAPGGKLRLSLRLQEIQEPTETTVGVLSEGAHLCLEITDSGDGIAPEIRDRIFEPFFTTKDPGQGTGLGLSMVQGIVLDHQGAIELRCPDEGGTTFELYFPICDLQTDSTAPVGQATPIGRRETILLIEDEPPLMTLGEKMLDRLGYHAVAMGDPRAALELFEQDPDRFDLVVTDLRMPEITGIEIAQAMRRLRPEVRILVTTGFSESDLKPHLEDGLIQGYLIKPFNLAAMGRSIAETLNPDEPDLDPPPPSPSSGASVPKPVH